MGTPPAVLAAHFARILNVAVLTRRSLAIQGKHQMLMLSRSTRAVLLQARGEHSQVGNYLAAHSRMVSQFASRN
ncbi:MAG: hypothetical protein ACJAVZ_001658 [Afipia broomeae]|jgi:hypothetical protein